MSTPLISEMMILLQVMLNTCKTTGQAMQLVQQARKAGIEPSERTCLKLAKMYIKEGNMPSHPGQLEAVMKGLKKTTLFSGTPLPASGLQNGEEQHGYIFPSRFVFFPSRVLNERCVDRLDDAPPNEVPASAVPEENSTGQASPVAEDEVARMLEQLLIKPPNAEDNADADSPGPTKGAE